jgi:hypothetical protein
MRKNLLMLTLLCTKNIFAQVAPVLADTSSLNKVESDSVANNFNVPILSTSGGDADADLEQQDVSSLLMSSRDVFTQFSGFQWGAAHYRMRGYMAENQQVMINGVNVNNLETGFSSWSSWGGLNDVTRFNEVRVGNVSNRYNFSGPGGYINIDSRASSFRKGTRISYASSNRIFSNRVMVTHSTGMLQNGWAFTISASSRWGNQVYIPGTYFQGNAVYISVDKRIIARHTLSFTGFGAPVEQGRAAAEQKEVYDLTGNHYYNSLWGYQNGKVRNSSVSRTNRPMLMLNHIFNISSTARLSSTVYYNFGRSSVTGFNWNNEVVPRPDYYKYLPGYYYNLGDTANADLLKNNWQNNVNDIQQINWDKLIAENQANVYSIPRQAANTTETRARYILENRIQNLNNKGINIVYNNRLNKFFISAGFNGNIYKDRKYKEVEDLLGATYWLDLDNFAQNLGVDPVYASNNLDDPYKKIYRGDRFGYDYSINMNRGELWGQGEYSFKALDVYVGLSTANTVVWREGFMQNGKFPDDSKGNSRKLDFFTYGIKGGVTYKISGRHFVTANGTFMTRNPEISNVFVSPTCRNDIVNGVVPEQVIGGDVNYLVKYASTRVRATYYYSQINHQTWLRTYYNELFNNFVNYIMTGVNETHQGVELSIEQVLFTSHTIQGAFGFGQYIYTNRPTAQGWQYNNNAELFENRTVYWKNYKVGGMPQMAAGLGYKYNGKKYWNAGIYFNYFDKIYVDINPDRRTTEAVEKLTINDESKYHAIVDQEKLPSYYTINISGGKSFRIIRKYFLNLNLSINNLLNNRNILVSGFEQLRWDRDNINKFPAKYYYMQGTTYMAILNFSF